MMFAYNPVLAAGVVLRRMGADGPRWLLLQGAGHGEWGFPKGHVDPGESLWQAALRECAEETGIATLVADGPQWELHYRLPSGRDKAVHYWSALTQASAVVLSNEHKAFQWATAEQALTLLPHDNVRALMRVVLATVKP